LTGFAGSESMRGSKRLRVGVVSLVVCALALLAGGGLLHAELGSLQAGIDRLLGKFTVADITERSLDGAPALAITFTEPLDPKQSYDKYVSVIEMPPRPEDKAPRPQSEDEEECCWEGGRNDPNKTTVVSTEAADLDTKGGKRVKGAWTVGDNPRILYFPHIRPQSRYVVRVAPELPDAAAKPLGEESKVSVRTATVSPAYYFASKGMVLPAKQNGGLPVVTVNVPEVDVQFLRVKNRELPAFLDQVIRGKPQPAGKRHADDEGNEGGEGDEEYDSWRYGNRGSTLQGAVYNWNLDQLHKLTDSVYAGRFTTEKRANRRSVSYLPVEDIKELQEPGVYVAVMSQPGRFRQEFQVTYFYVSDIGLHVKLFEKSADAWVSSLTDGKAVPGVDITWIDAKGKTIAQSKSDADGRAHFAERPAEARVVVARRDKQVSMIALKEPALDLSEYQIAGNAYKPVRLFPWAGRDLYRPGEAFTISVLARDADGRPVPPQPIQAILKRPDGQKLLTSSWSPDKRHAGYYQNRVELPADAATGAWTLELRADPADKIPASVFRFGVEEFLPEKMKLDLAASDAPLSPEGTLSIAVKGSYLYGAPAAGNRLLGVVQFERNKNPLAKQLPGFEFGDAGEESVKLREEIPESTLDAEGQATVEVALDKLAKRRSPFTVRATLSLLESGGRPIVRNIDRVSWPAQKMIGVRPLFVGDYAKEGSLAEFEVVRVDPAGKLLAGAGLPVRLFRENRNYYWRFEDQRGWHSGFTETDELVETTLTATPANGRGRLGVPVRYGRYRLEILDPESGQTLKYRFYAGWNARDDEALGIRPDKVTLKLDKAAYKDGDVAKLTITPPHAGEMIVTVEGGAALWTKRLALPAEGGSVDIPVGVDWKRHDLYVSVIALRPGSQGDRVTPTRAVGLIHLPLERGERKLGVTLEAPKKTQPGQASKVKIKVPGAKGQSALLTLSAVDVGILNITRFATPDPYRFFFDRQRYGADLHDVYGRLIEKMAGKKGKLKWGGDTTPKPTRSLPQKVELIDLFTGPIQLDANGEADIPLKLPDFNGTLRLMAVVAAPDRFGSSDTEMTVAAPVVAELLMPRFISFGDSATLALDLTNLTGGDHKFKVGVVGNRAVSVLDGDRAVSLRNQQKTTLRFTVLAGNEHGLHDLKVRVEGGGETFERMFRLMVQSPTPAQRIAKRFSVDPGKTIDIRDADLGGLSKGSLAAHLVLSDKPPIDVKSAIHGLLVYPYGCAEQTTSSSYPHVFVDEAAARQYGLKPFSREERARMLETSFGRLSTMQNPQGGFSLWGGGGDYDYWLTAYVTQFMQDAKQAGFAPPDALLDKARDFLLRGLQEGTARLPSVGQAQAANRGNGTINADFDSLVYGGYVLSREAKAPLATLRQLYDLRSQSVTGLHLVQLGLALRQMGDETRGKSAIEEGLAAIATSKRNWWHYGSPLRDAAQAYVLLAQNKVDSPARERLIDTMANELALQRWFSTQEQLALFLAGRELGQSAQGQGDWKAELVVGGKSESLARKGAQIRELTASDVSGGTQLKNLHNGRLYAEFVLSGYAAKALPPKNDVIKLSRTLYTPEGTPIGKRTLKVGETVVVRVEASSNVNIANGLVVDRIPAGLEIENRNLVQGETMGGAKYDTIDPVQAMSDRRIQHVEYRDDRFVAAVRFEGYNNKLNLFYRAKVVTPGRFVVPPLHSEDMYRPEIFGLTGVDAVTVVDAPVGGKK
jgi:alpha-2-macroglobulin